MLCPEFVFSGGLSVIYILVEILVPRYVTHMGGRCGHVGVVIGVAELRAVILT